MDTLYRALSLGFGAADAVVPKSWLPGLEPAALIAAAGANPGPDARAGLERLMASITAESDLSFFGRISLHWDALRLLRNAEMVEHAHRANPALARAPISQPVFILGLPRSGTTFLHELMAQDSESLVPRNWQTIYPAPRPAGFNPARDERVRAVDRQLRVFAGLAPGFSELHPITADSPQECTEIMAHVFQSLRFDATHRVPSYFAWLEAHGHLPAFHFHKKFLQFLQNGEPGRWVLKCPDHTFTLDAILRVYPDARFVVVHRDPIAVLASVARLTWILRKPFLRKIDLAEIGAQVSERWIEGANRLLDFDRRADVEPERKIHIHYDELARAPLAVIARIYARFGLPLRDEARGAMSRQIAAKPRGGYAKHAPYSLESFKLSPAALQKRFGPYVSQHCGAAGG
ncbi:putative sulfotransferase [Acidocella aquatica]|uniref:Sulfotransferase n=1 Tax=Acidocella aquatica TaxID=1922313 RepID=A0ABQ6A239_9PROT|nr:sulfotransferase [Acidocella aquatica]GLR65846.1 putative sulfotransferase [Acidocella aquatica]